MSDLRDRAVQFYDAFTHDHHDRRTLLRQMTALVGSVAAAEALILGIAASPTAAVQVAPADLRLLTRKGGFGLGDGGWMTGYFARPRDRSGKLGAVMVIHENRGLTPHIEDVARRVALAGFFVVAPDFLSAQGGTPADEGAARALIAKADYDAVIAQGIAVLVRLNALRSTTAKAGAVGFCWGGGLVNRLAVAAGDTLRAGVTYYGPAPAVDEAGKVKAALMLHYAGKDARVNATGLPWATALTAAGKSVESFVYPDIDHAFNNDTSAERYDMEAANLAWGRTIAFLHRALDH